MSKVKKYILIFALIAAMVLYVIYGFLIQNKKFNAEMWNDNIEIRHKMVDDLTNNYLKGLTRDEIIELLGKNALNNYNLDFIEYFVGGGYNEIYLRIDFDEQKGYKDYRIEYR